MIQEDGPDEYLEIWTVVDDARGEEAQIGDGDGELTEEFMEDARKASEDGSTVQVFSIYHQHPPAGDCACAQYETDHRPKVTFIHGKEVKDL